MSAEYRAVLFDFGGVFTDSPFAAVRAFAEEIGASDVTVTDLVFGGYGVDSDHPWHRVERGEITLEDAREQIRQLGLEHGLHLDIWEVFMAMGRNGGGLRTELIDYVRTLRAAGLGTGIITNNIVELREHWRGLLPVEELFDFVVDSSELGIRKPDPAIFLRALEIGGYAPEEVVFLDDYAGNVTAAQALGIMSLLVDGTGTETVLALSALLGR